MEHRAECKTAKFTEVTSIVAPSRSGKQLVFSTLLLTAVLASLVTYKGSTAIRKLHEVRSGAKPEMGVTLHRKFQDAGLPAPVMRMEVLLGAEPDFTLWIYDLLCSLAPQIDKHNVSLEALGDFETLPARLQAEVTESRTVVPYVPIVGAWSRKPAR